MLTLQEQLNAIKSKTAAMMTPEVSAAMKKGFEIFKLDPPRFNGDDSWALPMPSRFIVDQHAVIRAADVNLDHTVRPEPDTAIEVLRILKS